MTDKEVRKLNRTQLLTLLSEMSAENESLRAGIEALHTEVEALQARIGSLTVTNEKLESLAGLSRRILAALGADDVPSEPTDTVSAPESADLRTEEEDVPPVIEPEPVREEASSEAWRGLFDNLKRALSGDGGRR